MSSTTLRIDRPAGPDATPRGSGTARMGDWASRGRCLGTDPESLFVQGSAQHQAKRICSGCPVRMECLADALDNRTEFGVWGGMTERERRALLRRRPGVESWYDVLDSADQQARAALQARSA